MVLCLHIIASVFLATFVAADYDCLCNYAVERKVLASPSDNAQVLGYMYEFDCKPRSMNHGDETNYYVIQFEKQLGYVKGGNNEQVSTCPGSPPTDDLVPATTLTPVTTAPTRTTTVTTTRQPTTTQSTTITTTTQSSTTTRKPTTQPPTTRPTTPTTPTTTSTTTTRPTTPSTTTPTTTSTTTTRPTTPSTTTPPTTQTPTTVAMTTLYPRVPLLAVDVSGTRLQYIGVGYNLLEGNPDGRNNPGSGVANGALYSRRIFQLSLTGQDTATEVEYIHNTTCTSSRTTNLVYNGKVYQDELLQYVVPDGSHPVELVSEAFTYSQEMADVRHVTEANGQQSGTLYRDVINTCSEDMLRFKDELTDTATFTITQEFAQDVCNLTESSSMKPYFLFLDKWGTSIITEVHMGIRSMSRYQTNSMQLFENIEQTDARLIQHAGLYEGFASSLIINAMLYPSSKASQGTIGTLHSSLHDGSTGSLAPIKVKVVPITQALDFKYWKHVINQLMMDGICEDSVDDSVLMKMAVKMNEALKQYSGYKNSLSPFQHSIPLKDYQLQMPVTWPLGTYGLMEAKTGCPAGKVSWQTGWRRQDGEDHNPHNYFTAGIGNYLAGGFSNKEITSRYCIKVSSSATKFDRPWPKGSYCLLKRGGCPSGFGQGYVYWDDEDINNNNGHGGYLPDGTYNSNTKIYYCCRGDGSASTPIDLPTDRPFVLVRYHGACQSVYGMNTRDTFVRWDDEDSLNSDSRGGTHPLDEGGNDDHRLHFCHYQSNHSGGGPPIIG